VQDEQNLTADIPNINSKVIKHRTDGQHARIAARLCAGRAAQVYERYQCGARASEPAVGALLTLAAVLNPVPEGMAPGANAARTAPDTRTIYANNRTANAPFRFPVRTPTLIYYGARKPKQYLLKGCTGCCSETQCVPPSTLGLPSFQRCASTASLMNTVLGLPFLGMLLYRLATCSAD